MIGPMADREGEFTTNTYRLNFLYSGKCSVEKLFYGVVLTLFVVEHFLNCFEVQ